jgi:hypothetical protein
MSNMDFFSMFIEKDEQILDDDLGVELVIPN